MATALTEHLCGRAERPRTRDISLTLAIVRMGERSEDLSYGRGAYKYCEIIGVSVKHSILPVSCIQEELLMIIHRIDEGGVIHGCLFFHPLPRHLDEAAVCAVLSPVKDVDGTTSDSLASVFSDDGQGYPPCTAQTCLELLDYYGFEPTDRHAVVVGYSLVTGRPIVVLLLNRNVTVTLCYTRTTDLTAECRRAEPLIAAAGRVGIIDANCLSPSQVAIDMGIDVDAANHLVGDVDFAAAETVVGAVTPVLGSVGIVTTSVLARYVLDAVIKSTDTSLQCRWPPAECQAVFYQTESRDRTVWMKLVRTV